MEDRRVVGWLVCGVFALGALHSLIFYANDGFRRLWLHWIRDPLSPLVNPWIFLGLQAVAVMELLAGWADRGIFRRRPMYYLAFWTSLIGFWWFFRMENLLVLFGVSLVLMILTLVDLKKGSLPGGR